RRPHPEAPARPATRARRAHALGARVGARDVPLRRDEAPARAGGRGPRRRPPLGPGAAALPEPGADPADPRPVDRQVHRAPGFGAREPQGGTGGHGMSTMTETGVTQVYRVYIKATPEAIWDAITKPEWSERYGYPGRAEYDLRPGGSYRVT